MRPWRNLKDFARVATPATPATPLTRHSSGGLRDARNCNVPPLSALPQSRRALESTTPRHSTPRPAGFLPSVDGTGKGFPTSTTRRCPVGSPVGCR